MRLNFWKWCGESRYPGALSPLLENFCPAFSPDPTDCPWVFEDAVAVYPGLILVRPLQWINLTLPKLLKAPSFARRYSITFFLMLERKTNDAGQYL